MPFYSKTFQTTCPHEWKQNGDNLGLHETRANTWCPPHPFRMVNNMGFHTSSWCTPANAYMRTTIQQCSYSCASVQSMVGAWRHCTTFGKHDQLRPCVEWWPCNTPWCIVEENLPAQGEATQCPDESVWNKTQPRKKSWPQVPMYTSHTRRATHTRMLQLLSCGRTSHTALLAISWQHTNIHLNSYSTNAIHKHQRMHLGGNLQAIREATDAALHLWLHYCVPFFLISC